MFQLSKDSLPRKAVSLCTEEVSDHLIFTAPHKADSRYPIKKVLKHRVAVPCPCKIVLLCTATQLRERRLGHDSHAYKEDNLAVWKYYQLQKNNQKTPTKYCSFPFLELQLSK